MPLDRWEGHRHALGEYWVHTQDVARPQGVRQPPVDDELAEALWLRVQRAAAALHRRSRGLTLVHADGRRATVTRGAPTVAVRGSPEELMCWAPTRWTQQFAASLSHNTRLLWKDDLDRPTAGP